MIPMAILMFRVYGSIFRYWVIVLVVVNILFIILATILGIMWYRNSKVQINEIIGYKTKNENKNTICNKLCTEYESAYQKAKDLEQTEFQDKYKKLYNNNECKCQPKIQ